MAISTMNWYPDTCQCIIEQTHDPQDPAYGVKFSKVIRKCTLHTTVPDDQLNSVIYENPASDQKRKNVLEGYLLETAGLGLSETIVDSLGNATLKWKAGISYNWKFTGTGERVLEISIDGINLSNSIKTTIQSYCDSVFGVGKVIII